ncbi:MAG: hypothetical protein COU08_03840 [Candidatus Harrisonbacteria bacterium CG10_big_fil_rev_8_21_14_0_10_42_17]|uniref:Prepilin-type N-terminal cleavage/methylation domain-containing protein n=1 Tax=Candidatus Harrisonbacteria bacterium CG10_big_fil_rev_8_21_14_0_10_42_17 TaxID=1974584 RepID=A0A2M6WHA9_9BACT|nr:MAG: hypothetical protein COU08_03840 [Candidatus Harrisonbacteria bacterium CG10_big_fil_rev_8_21_14_0_10_42_17]
MKQKDVIKETKYNAGFTIIELLVSMGLFTIVISLGVAVFIAGLNRQKTVTEFINVNENLNLVMEQVVRELRTGDTFEKRSTPNLGTACSIPLIEKIVFINDVGDRVRYFMCQVGTGANTDRGIAFKGGPDMGPGSNAPVERLTPSSMFITRMNIEIRNEAEDDVAPLITIAACARSKRPGLEQFETCIQNSVSARDVD